ncbi:MAG: NYN domain-containing protein [Cytophagales bacterium]|nr:NYN domain-containing protein [Cytophagales bacterium]MDW8384536.1 NYN domain-containing protein [Flammeovirgaceae bacterium]
MFENDGKLIKIGVFYDGNYFFHVSNYYNYEHPRNARLSISGLHEFIRNKVAEYEKVELKFCHIVDAHYFRGRLSSYDAEEQNKLLAERIFDDILMSEGVVTHYLPLRIREGKREEKGIDVWLALEAFELSMYKKFNVVVLIACDGDYVSLVRKLNTLGIRVMVIGWDFEFTDERTGRQKRTTTSLELLKEATYPILMHEIIDNKINRNDALINNLFVQKEIVSKKQESLSNELGPTQNSLLYKRSTIFSIKQGYGFISYPPSNLFFHYSAVVNDEFSQLKEGDWVEFRIEKRENSDVAVDVRRI